MAVTPSKDYKRREREQKKFDKRMAREAARAEAVAAKEAADLAAAVEAEKLAGLSLLSEEEIAFEAELEAERQAKKLA
jgi:hypothetical protein